MPIRRPILAWALYDWANSAFATVMLAGFFPIFFREFWAHGAESARITFTLGTANSLASLGIVMLAPILGAIADQGGYKKRLLWLFATLGAVLTGSLFWIAQGDWHLAILLYVLASIGFMGGNVFYDALLVNVTTAARYDRVSAFGFALGYLGGGLLFAFCVVMTLQPQWFGLADAAAAVQLSFLLTAIWWLTFSIPLLMFVHEPRPAAPLGIRRATQAGFSQLRDTFREVRKLRAVWVFLLAYWLYIDGVDTVIVMAVDYGKALGFETKQLITALLITQFIGFPAAVAFGRLGERLGTRNGILLAIGGYCLVTLWASQIQESWEFFALATCIGLIQGGIQALSRSYYARLIPPERAAEFFGFYNMLGKFAAVLGPLLVGGIGLATGNPRIGLLSLLVLFVGGALVLWCVPDESRGHRGVSP
ncbi:MAG: MFS transporter [Thiotrichales bacterium]